MVILIIKAETVVSSTLNCLANNLNLDCFYTSLYVFRIFFSDKL